MTDRTPFDPADRAEQMADMFRRQVAEIALVANQAPMFQRLEPREQISSFMAGVLTGLVGVCFSSIEPAGHDEIMKTMKKYLPLARENAEGIMADGARK